jgi:hypothetical protein
MLPVEGARLSFVPDALHATASAEVSSDRCCSVVLYHAIKQVITKHKLNEQSHLRLNVTG